MRDGQQGRAAFDATQFVEQTLAGLKAITTAEWASTSAPATVDSTTIVAPDGTPVARLAPVGSRTEDRHALPIAELLVSAANRILTLEGEVASARREARMDALTGLENRRGWDLALRAASDAAHRDGGHAGIIVIDLDGLKELNDREGHHAGDVLLCLAAEVLRRNVHPADVIARTGGDEFAVLVSPALEPRAVALAARLRAELHAAGIGHAVGWSTSREGEPLATTWIRADRRMYRDKKARTGESMRDR